MNKITQEIISHLKLSPDQLDIDFFIAYIIERVIFSPSKYFTMNFRPHITKTKNPDGSHVDEPRTESIIKYMVPIASLVTFQSDQHIYEVMNAMIDKKISGAPVMDNDEFVGIISEKDCLHMLCDIVYNQQEKVKKVQVADYMSTRVEAVSNKADVLEVAEKFIHSTYRRYPVVDENNKLIGQISRRDILRAAIAMR